MEYIKSKKAEAARAAETQCAHAAGAEKEVGQRADSLGQRNRTAKRPVKKGNPKKTDEKRMY